VRDTPPTALYTQKFSVPADAGRISVGMTPTLHAGYSKLGTLRWQILGAGFNGAGQQIAARIMKADSGWRYGCVDGATVQNGGYPCTPSANAECVDGASGISVNGQIQNPANFTAYNTIYWCKPAGVTCFELAILSPCKSVDWTYELLFVPGSCNPSTLPDANQAP
jgi:hypothetical protein